MKNIVFLSPNMGEPFTTSDVIAEFAGFNMVAVSCILLRGVKSFYGH